MYATAATPQFAKVQLATLGVVPPPPPVLQATLTAGMTPATAVENTTLGTNAVGFLRFFCTSTPFVAAVAEGAEGHRCDARRRRILGCVRSVTHRGARVAESAEPYRRHAEADVGHAEAYVGDPKGIAIA